MDTSHIKEFLVMAKTLNYTAASDELFISQSSIFKHIKALEDELEVQLFEKSGKRVILTDYGKMFIHNAEVILRQLENYHIAVENHREAQANILNLIDEYPNPELDIAFRKAYPQFSINPQFMNTVDDVLNSNAELLILRGELPEFEEKFDYDEVFIDSIAAIVPLNHPLADLPNIRMIDLKNEGIIGFSLSNQILTNNRLETMHDVASMCRGAGFEPNIVMSAFPGSEVARLVAQGGGISLLYKNATKRRMGEQVAYVDLKPEMTFPIRIYHKKGQALSRVAQAYISFALDWYESYK